MYFSREKVAKVTLLGLVAFMCLLIVAVITQGVNHFKSGSQLAGINQVSNLSHLLVRQQAKLFSMMLVKNSSSEELADALDIFAKEDFVIDATLYASNGVQLAKSRETVSFPHTAEESEGNELTQQIVEPIFDQQNLIGFLRVTFDMAYGQTTRNKIDALFHLLYGELIILFLAGGLFVSCFYYFSKQVVHVPHLPRLLPKNEPTQTLRFHSRRRTFRRK